MQAVKSVHLIKRRHGQANRRTFPAPPPQPPTPPKCFRRGDLCADTNEDMDIHLKHHCPWHNFFSPQPHMARDDTECPVADTELVGLTIVLPSPVADTERPKQAVPVCTNPLEEETWTIASSDHENPVPFAQNKGS